MKKKKTLLLMGTIVVYSFICQITAHDMSKFCIQYRFLYIAVNAIKKKKYTAWHTTTGTVVKAV